MALFAFGKHNEWGAYFIVEATDMEDAKEKLVKSEKFLEDVNIEETYGGFDKNNNPVKFTHEEAFENVKNRYFKTAIKLDGSVWFGEWA